MNDNELVAAGPLRRSDHLVHALGVRPTKVRVSGTHSLLTLMFCRMAAAQVLNSGMALRQPNCTATASCASAKAELR